MAAVFSAMVAVGSAVGRRGMAAVFSAMVEVDSAVEAVGATEAGSTSPAVASAVGAAPAAVRRGISAAAPAVRRGVVEEAEAAEVFSAVVEVDSASAVGRGMAPCLDPAPNNIDRFRDQLVVNSWGYWIKLLCTITLLQQRI